MTMARLNWYDRANLVLFAFDALLIAAYVLWRVI